MSMTNDLERTADIGTAPDSLALSADDFKAAFRNYPAGVALITADDGTGPVAMTATSVTSVSADPALLTFSVSDLSSASTTIRQAETVIVHLLGADDLNLAMLGAARGVDRFADPTAWSRLETGEPYFHGARCRIRGQVIDRMTAGTSTITVVNALDAFLSDTPVAPLVYHNRTWHQLDERSQLT
jgi:flavin reductase (DIM6/NTAB) family NADH-FMN oxidoreductase RutF